MLTAFQPPRGHKNAIWGYNRISLQPPRTGLRGRSRAPEPPCFRRFRRFRKPGQKRQPSFAAIRAGQYGHFSAASRLPVSAGDRHRPRVPSLIAVPVSSPFREGFPARECSAPLRFFGFPCVMPRFSRRLPSVPVPYRRVRPCRLFFRCSAAAFPTPVVTDALMNAGQKLDILQTR